jgi:hypothetical protein
MNKLRIISDVHCKTEEYGLIVHKSDCPTLQIGDFGFKQEHDWHMQNIDPENNKIVFGNHDDTRFVHAPHSMGHFGLFHGIFCVRGAFTPDAWRRDIGVDLFMDEQLDYGQQQDAMELYMKTLPKVVVSHDCPKVVRESIVYYNDASSTPKFLQHLYDAHQPEIWVFGHYHRNIDETLVHPVTGKETLFVCREELGTYDINI